jgi:hypothetical protein
MSYSLFSHQPTRSDFLYIRNTDVSKAELEPGLTEPQGCEGLWPTSKGITI